MRIAVALVAAAASLACLILGRAALLGLMIVASVAAAGELLRLARARGAGPVSPVALAAVVALLSVAHVRGERAPASMAVVIALATVLTFVGMLLRRDRAEVTEALAHTLLPVLCVGLLGSYVLALRGARDGFRAVLALVMMAIANDVAGSLAAARRGRHLPRDASPAGDRIVAGTIATLLVAVVVALTLDPPLSWASTMTLGLLVCVVSPLGDRARAMLERDLPATARRAIVLDRIDTLLFSAPVFFYAFRLLER